MSIICAVNDGDSVAVASDTLAGGNNWSYRSVPKWIPNGRYWIGVTGFFKTINIVQENAERLDGPHPADIARSLREILIDSGFKPGREKDDSGYEDFGCSLMLVAGDQIWEIDPLLAVTPIVEPYYCLGSGSEFAFGALSTLRRCGYRDARTLAKLAVEAAIECDDRCGGDVWVQVVSDGSA